MRVIAQKQAEQSMKDLIAKTYDNASDKRVLVFDVSVSPIACIDYPEVLLIVCPDDIAANDNWTATTVRKEYGTFEGRVKFPDAWLGLRDGALAEASGISNAIFCHKGGFIFVAGSKEGVMAAVEKVVG